MIQDRAAYALTRELGKEVDFDRGFSRERGYWTYIQEPIFLGATSAEARKYIRTNELRLLVQEIQCSERAWAVYHKAAGFEASVGQRPELQDDVRQLADNAVQNAYDTYGKEKEGTPEFGACILAGMEMLLSVRNIPQDVTDWFAAAGVRA